MTRIARYLVLLVIPTLMVVTTLSIGAAKGPYWVGMNHDPGGQYLLNALNLAKLRPTGHTMHPGTAVQVAGAAIIKGVHAVAAPSGEELEPHVLANPGLYLRAIQLTFLFVNALALFGLGAVVLHALDVLALALMVQLAPFYPHVLAIFGFGSTEVRAESFLLLSSILLAGALVLFTQRAAALQDDAAPDAADRRHLLQRRGAAWFGMVCGFGMAAKVGFLPLLLVPLFVLRGRQYWRRYVLATIATFVFLTLPIVAEYPRMFLWLALLAMNSGVHGQGSSTFVDPDLFVNNLTALLDLELVFASILGISLLVLTLGFVVPRFRTIAAGHVYFRALMGLMSAQVVGLALVSKHSKGWEVHYLMPVSSLAGLSLMLSVCCLVLLATNRRTLAPARAPAEPSTGRDWRDFALPVSATLALVGLIALAYDLRWKEIGHVSTGQSQARDQRMQVHEILERDYADYVKVFYLGSSSPAYALYYSNSEAKFYYSEALERQFPNVYFYDPFTTEFHDWSYRVLPFEVISASRGGRVVFQGPRFAELAADVSRGQTAPDPFKAPLLPLTEVVTSTDRNDFRQRRETIYVLRTQDAPLNGQTTAVQPASPVPVLRAGSR